MLLGKYNTQEQQKTAIISVTTYIATDIRIVFYDYDNPETKYFERIIYTDPHIIYVRKIKMPITPKTLAVYVTPKRFIKEINFELKDGIDNKCVSLLDQKTDEFVRFALDFSIKANYIPTGKIYYSPSKTFAIHYVDTIRNSTTPALVKYPSKLIVVSKWRIKNHSVAMRFAILCHEFGHVFPEKELPPPHNDFAADLYGFNIFLSLGFGAYEYLKSFLDVFNYSNTLKNRMRYFEMKKFAIKYQKKYSNNNNVCFAYHF